MGKNQRVKLINCREIGQRIARRRNVLDLTQAQLEELADIGYVGNIERGTSIPSLEALMKLASALQVTPDYLLLGVDKDFRNDDLNEIKSVLYRCNPVQIKFIKNFINWFADEELKTN